MIKSAYFHIPFCKTICSYCDFCKQLYNETLIDKYLTALEKEVKLKYRNESLATIYVGGGTPSSLSIKELTKLFKIINLLKKDKIYEFTFECNIEDINEELLQVLKRNKVNRLSIGVETFNKKFLSFLNRNHTKEDIINKINLIKSYNFTNINIDLMYAFPKETIKDVENDLKNYLLLDIPHISMYSLIIEDNTILSIKGIKPINQDLDSKMYDLICTTLENNNYIHYEVSNFSKEGYESCHNLTYWNNLEYYGFGLSASGYINNIRYTNTRSINNYIKGKYLQEEDIITKEKDMSNEMILGLRKLEGVSKSKFYHKFGKEIKDQYDIIDLLDNKLLEENEEYIFIPKNKIYISNEILIRFL